VPPSDPAGITALAHLLATAERPLLLAGRGAWLAGAGSVLGELADAIGAVTASTALGRGLFPDSRYDLGVAGGFGADGAMELARDADVAVVFGASLNQFTMRFGELFGPTTRVVQVDTAAGATHARVDDFVRGDAALVARSLVDELSATGGQGAGIQGAGGHGAGGHATGGHRADGRGTGWRGTGWRDSVDVPALLTRAPGDGVAPDGRLDPRSVARRLGELLPRDRVVVSDGGHFIGWANMYWPVTSPDRMIMVGTAYQSIGLGWPSVPGAAAARPESTIVLSTGDGGGLMALADLESAVRSAAGRGLAVVWNDAAYGAEVNLYGLQGLAQAPMRIPEVDFAALGSAVGAQGVVVRELADLDALQSWSRRAPGERPFLVLDVRVSPDVIAPYQQEIIRINR
jgi:thiamine pyrophosphate-dependent acetolactate synthase large subunit-like protein